MKFSNWIKLLVYTNVYVELKKYLTKKFLIDGMMFKHPKMRFKVNFVTILCDPSRVEKNNAKSVQNFSTNKLVYGTVEAA